MAGLGAFMWDHASYLGPYSQGIALKAGEVLLLVRTNYHDFCNYRGLPSGKSCRSKGASL